MEELIRSILGFIGFGCISIAATFKWAEEGWFGHTLTIFLACASVSALVMAMIEAAKIKM